MTQTFNIVDHDESPTAAAAVELTRSPTRSRHRQFPVVITARDVRILRDLFDSRILTARQLADIHFGGSQGAAKQRLWALKRAGYLVARFGVTMAMPEPIRITKLGFDHLRQAGHLDDYPRLTWLTMSKRLKVSDLTLAHEIDVGTFKAALHRSARQHADVAIKMIVTWPRLLRFRVRPPHRTQPVSVSPDGFARFTQTRGDAVHQTDVFIEVDRSTETIGRIVERMQAYAAYFSTGAYAKRQGVTGAEPRDYPFRVLWTFKTKARRESFLRACREHERPILKMAWAGLFSDVVRDPLQSYWQRPVDTDSSCVNVLLAKSTSSPGSRE